MYVFNTTDPSLISGYFPEDPTLQNKCTYFQGFYSEFKIDYTQFNESGATYEAIGSDLEVCFKSTTSVPAEL